MLIFGFVQPVCLLEITPRVTLDPKGFSKEELVRFAGMRFFTGQMLFLSPNHQSQSTDGK